MTELETITDIAERNDVRVSEPTIDDDDVESLTLHGSLSNIQAVARQVTGWHVDQTNTGLRLSRQL